jgi:hypothetical protein
MRALKISLVFAATAIAGCGGSNAVDSETVETQGLWVGVRFEASGTGATGINVELNEGGSSGNDVRLSANERLEVNANGLVVVLEEDEDFLDVDYEGSVPTDASDTLFTLSLFRADGSVNNITRVNLPNLFTITSPANNQAVTVGDIINVQWSPVASGAIAMGVMTQCSGFTRADFLDLPDNGSYTIDTAALPGIQDPAIPRENGCTLTIDLTRERRGTIDPAFRGGGFVSAVQERIVRLPLSF